MKETEKQLKSANSRQRRIIGRPKIKTGSHRVRLSVRVTPETRRALEALKPSHGSIGKAIDSLIKLCR